MILPLFEIVALVTWRSMYGVTMIIDVGVGNRIISTLKQFFDGQYFFSNYSKKKYFTATIRSYITYIHIRNTEPNFELVTFKNGYKGENIPLELSHLAIYFANWWQMFLKILTNSPSSFIRESMSFHFKSLITHTCRICGIFKLY